MSAHPTSAAAMRDALFASLHGDRGLAVGTQCAVPPELQNTFDTLVEADLTKEVMRFVIALEQFRCVLKRISVVVPNASDACKDVTFSLAGVLIELSPLSFELVAALLRSSQRSTGGMGTGHDVK